MLYAILSFGRRILMLAGGVWLAACFCASTCAWGESRDANVLLLETFADQDAALGRWDFTAGGPASLTIVEADEIAKKPAVYVDFRERASWRFLSKRPIQLEAGTQYTLSARVRRNLGYGTIRLIAQTPPLELKAAGLQPARCVSAPAAPRRDPPAPPPGFILSHGLHIRGGALHAGVALLRRSRPALGKRGRGPGEEIPRRIGKVDQHPRRARRSLGRRPLDGSHRPAAHREMRSQYQTVLGHVRVNLADHALAAVTREFNVIDHGKEKK